ncbi:MAG TPA: VTT domain-containing protein [Vicinamibacterales bacterium]|jgi:membrane protein YqaA with SNARE-associated domain
MKSLVTWASGLVLTFGGPGLFVVAFLDASFLSLPEINDILVVWMVTQHKDRFPYYATMATLGSVAGCYVLYWLARKGGEAFLRTRFSEGGIKKGLDAFQRYGLLALLVPSILPPPAPFKVFVLLAGLAGVKPAAFLAAILLGRGVRYFGEGLLAVWYGDAAMDYIQTHGDQVALATALVVLAAGLVYVWWRRRSPTPS